MWIQEESLSVDSIGDSRPISNVLCYQNFFDKFWWTWAESLPAFGGELAPLPTAGKCATCPATKTSLKILCGLGENRTRVSAMRMQRITTILQAQTKKFWCWGENALFYFTPSPILAKIFSGC